MSAQKVVDRLEEMGILDPKFLADLRRHLRESRQPVPAEAVLKLLVDKQQITAFQAKKLLAEIGPARAAGPPAASPKAASQQPSAARPARAAKPADDIEELQLVDDPAPSPPAKPKTDDDEIVDLEEALPPATSETPIRATLKQVETPAPKPPGEKKKRVILPPAPTSFTTDDLMKSPPPKSAVVKPAGPAAASSAASRGGDGDISLPGLQPLSNPGPGSASPLADLGSPLASLPPANQLGDPLLGSLSEQAVAEAKPAQEVKKPKLKKKKAGSWDSALLMIGSAALGVLLLSFVLLWYALGQRSSSAIVEKANEAYKAAQYPTAQALYEKYAREYPKESDSSAARVRVAMSQLRQVFDGAKDHTSALNVASKVLPTVEGEKNFDDVARPELQSILPDIADSFATSARKATSTAAAEKYVALANRALELVNNASYLPTTRRREIQPRIDAIVEKIQIAERAINQDKALQDALSQIEKRLEERSIAGANAVRDQLLQSYPHLERSTEVQQAVAAISEREREFVSAASPNQVAATDDRLTARHEQITLARRKSASLAGNDGDMTAVLARGAAYGLETATGKVKWRRFLGVESNLPPLLLPNGNFLLSDLRTNDLLAVSRDKGKLQWRQALEEPFHQPVVRGDQIYVTLRSGRLLQLNLGNGTITQSLTFPQRLPAELAIDPAGVGGSVRAYQVAERSTLFTCSLSETSGEPLSAKEAYFVGHKPGAIAVPPVVVLGHVFLFENAGKDYSLVHILARKEEGKLGPLREPLRLRGRVFSSPTSTDLRQLTILTDLGDVVILKVDLSNEASPVSVVARMTGSHEQPTQGYALLDRSKLYVTDRRLAEYDVLTTREALDRGKAEYDGDSFLAPLQLHNRTLIHVRQRAGSPAIRVAGTHLDAKQSWELVLGGPMAGAFAYPEKRLFTAISSDGELFNVGEAQFQERLSDTPAESVNVIGLQAPLALGPARQLFRDRKGESWVLYDPARQTQLKRVDLVGIPPFSAPLVLWENGVLAASDQGSIWWLDPETGKPLQGTTPFQPPLGPGTKIHWLPPAVVDARQFVAVNVALKTLFVVRRDEKPQSFLAEAQRVDLAAEPVALAVMDKLIAVAVRGAASDELRFYTLPNCELQGKTDLEGRLTPRGFDVLPSGLGIETLEKKFLRINAEGQIAWRAELPHSPLAGSPVVVDGELLVVSQSGEFAFLKDETGEVREGAKLNEPALGGPRVIGKRVLISGIDGTLHLIDPVDARPAPLPGVAQP